MDQVALDECSQKPKVVILASEIFKAALSLIHHVFASFVMEAEAGPLD